jgi:DNA polymerase
MNLDLIIEVLKLRQAALRVTASKLERGLDATRNDTRLYDQMGYHGTHTGRPIGRGMQVLNLPKGVPIELDKFLDSPRSLADLDAQIPYATAKRGTEVSADDILSSLIRPCLYAENFCIADYSAIEARGVAWMAGDTKALEVFTSGGDPYQEFANEFGTTRQVGKIAELGCGYGMSGKKMEIFAKASRVDLGDMTPDTLVKAYRQKHPKIVRLWRLVDRAIFLAVDKQQDATVGKCSIYHDGSTLFVKLPSGRILNYRNARIEDRLPGYDRAVLKPSVVYSPPTRRAKEDPALWGSKAVENFCQAICRDICYDALIRCEQEGLHPVFHAYDEIVTEDDPSRLVDLCRIMRVTPAWAKGFPLEVEGRNARRYGK